MQDTLFMAVLDRSLVGCYCIAVTLIVRLFLKKCGRKYAYYLWLAVFLNLCFPVAVTGNFSLIPRQVADFSVRDEFPHVGEVLTGLTGTGWTAEQEALAEPQLHILTADGTVRSEEDAKAGADGEDAVSLAESVQEKEEAESPENTQAGAAGTFDGTGRGTFFSKAAGLTWLLGILLLLTYNALSILGLQLRLSKSTCIHWQERERIAELNGIASPFVWGLLRPVIYLPSDMEEEEKTYILAHENFHRRRKDHLAKALAYAVTAVHWFNPLVWLAYSLFCKDMEISCDEAVLAHSRKNIRKAYAASLLKYAAKQNGYLMTPLTFGEPSVKSRIQSVLHYKKKSAFISVVAVLCVLGVSAGLFFYPAENRKAEGSTGEQETGNTFDDSQPEGESGQMTGSVINNGGRVIQIGKDMFYMDGLSLYSDGERLYVSVWAEDGKQEIRAYKPDGSFEKMTDGRIVDSTEDGSILYCMFPVSAAETEYFGWYDTRTGESRSFYRSGGSGEKGVSCLGRFDGYLYVSRQEADGIYIDRIRESDRVAETDILGKSIPSGNIITSFYADGNKVLYASGEIQGSMGLFYGSVFSCDLSSGEIHEADLTDAGTFAAFDGYIYYQKEKELFRTPFDLSGEEQVGEQLTFLKFRESDGTILASKQMDESIYEKNQTNRINQDLPLPNPQGICNLVRVNPDGSEEELLLDMAHMLGYEYDISGGLEFEDQVRMIELEEKNIYGLSWEMEDGDKILFSEVDEVGDSIYVKAEQIGYREDFNSGWRDSKIAEINMKIDADGQVSLWKPETMEPGWEDLSYLTDPVPGNPCDPQEAGWDLENVIDVRDTFAALPYTPEPGTEDNTYLLGKTENYTLYGKGDYEFMLLERNGRYSEIHYPYTSNYMTPLDLMEFDYDRDGIEELAIKFNVKHGTGVYIDTLLLADFWGDGQLYVHQFTEEDFTAQLMEHLSSERTEEGLLAYVDGKPLGKVMADDEAYGAYERVSVGGQVRFYYGDCRVFIGAYLEFWRGDEQAAIPEYNDSMLWAELSFGNQGEISLVNTEGRNYALENDVRTALELYYMDMDTDEKDTYIRINELRYRMDELENDRIEVEAEILPVGAESYDYAMVSAVKTEYGWNVEDILLEK